MSPSTLPLTLPLMIGVENAVGLGVAVVLLAFVVCALLLPEKF